MKKRMAVVFLAAAMLLNGCAGEGKAGENSQGKSEKQSEKQSENQAEEISAEQTGGSADISDIIPEETVTLDVYSQLQEHEGEQQGWFAQEMLERFNVKLNYINDGSEGLYERLAAEGDLGDIVIWGTDTEQYHSAIDAGLLLDWEQNGVLGQYGSYMQENMAKALEKNKQNSGGHIYGFGYDVAAEGGEFGDFDYHPDIRWDLYEQIGEPEVTTLEDYVGVLKEMKEICPLSDNGEETYGVSLFPDWDGDMVMFVKSTCTNFFGVDEFGLGFYDADDGSFQGCLEEDGYYIRALKFYNELYRNDLLAPDSRNQSYDDCISDYSDGTAFFCIFGWMAAPAYNNVAHTADGKMMLPLAAEDQDTLVYGLNENGGNRLWTIGSKTEYPELTMAIINWLCTPEGRLVMEYGPKGVCWDYDMEGNACIMEAGYKSKNGEEVVMPEGSGYEGTWAEGNSWFNNTTLAINTINPDSNGQTYNYEYWPNVLSISVSEIEERWREKNNVSSIREYLSGFEYSVSKPNTYTASAKSDELGNKWAEVAACIKENSWDAIYAESEEEFEQIVQKMRQEAVEKGYEECAEWCRNEAALRKASEQ